MNARVPKTRLLAICRTIPGLCLSIVLAMCFLEPPCKGAERRFTVADDIELSHFGDPYTGQADAITFSPDGRYFVVDTERGRLDLNRPESTLHVYRTTEVRRFVQHPEIGGAPLPFWTLSKSSYKDGPIITQIRWLSDSSGIAFLAKNSSGNDQLILADLRTRKEHSLTAATQQVTGFDVRDRNHYVYCAQSPLVRENAIEESRAASIVANGRNIYNLLFGTSDPHSTALLGYDLNELWAVVDGRRFKVTDKSRHSVAVRYDGQQALALSPDGQSVVTLLASPQVPLEWETWYQPPRPSNPYRIRAGRQDPGAIDGRAAVSEYVVIRLLEGRIESLTGAPVGSAAGWWAFLRPAWTSDGHSVVLPNTFLPPGQHVDSSPNPPCVAVVNLVKHSASCLEQLKGPNQDGAYAEGFLLVRSVSFWRNQNTRIAVQYLAPSGSRKVKHFSLDADDQWKVDPAFPEPPLSSIDILVRQNLNQPPALVARNRDTTLARTILDPNPQLKDIILGKVSIIQWKDKTGRDWKGGLYKPPDYREGQRYPLVIQTHGFDETRFAPSGAFPTGFAAQELAATGIIVLQVEDCPIRLNMQEAPCQIAGYEAAVERLDEAGLIDPTRVGISGFSRTCYYVMKAITDSAMRFKAASITDGIVFGYVGYIMGLDVFDNAAAHEANAVIGAPPFDEGLKAWVANSPGFNLHKVNTPLLVVARGRGDLLSMWEPYAGLRYSNRPVELLLLTQEGTHVLTNPEQRAISQGATVDWFRFWLQDDEDPDPAKRAQYVRWRKLRELQRNSAGSKAAFNNTVTQPR